MDSPTPAESGSAASMVEPDARIEDEEERMCKFYVSIVSAPGGVALLDTMDNATLVAKFQKEDGSCPECFSPSDPIYVSLTFSNPTCEDIYVVLARKNFPRGGIDVILQGGERHPRMITTRNASVAKKLAPGEHYTFTPRKPCGGREVKDETDGHLDAFLWEYVPYWTPAKAGTYTVEFPPWEEKFSFVIGEKTSAIES